MSAARKDEKTSLLRRLDQNLQRWVLSLIFEMRRTRRVIVDRESQRTGEIPIFITGVHRSGTTLLRLIMDSHSRIACPPESFFIAPLGELLKDEKALSGLEAMGFTREHVLARLRETASYFFEMYAASRGKPRWADKTPSYVSCLELIDALYGSECRYVFIYRHGLDAACSIPHSGIPELELYLEACGGDRFAAAARYWADQCQKMIDFKARYPSRCHELRYHQLVQDPELHLRQMFEFLEEPFEPEVLRFYEKPHDVWPGLEDRKAAGAKGFAPRIGVWRDQPDEVIESMLREAGPMLTTLGYLPDPGTAK